MARIRFIRKPSGGYIRRVTGTVRGAYARRVARYGGANQYHAFGRAETADANRRHSNSRIAKWNSERTARDTFYRSIRARGGKVTPAVYRALGTPYRFVRRR